ncbi:MAG TPA: S8 family serine peptidase, partial [Roseiflexaceae bacterium]|nr:S8 family serine peptidase [Roseiflexaceae bacterium]
MNKHVAVLIVLLLALVGLPTALQTTTVQASAPAALDPALAATLRSAGATQPISVIAVLRDQANLGAVGGNTRKARKQNTVKALRAKADATQAPLRSLLQQRKSEGKVQSFTPLWVQNALALTALPEVIAELSQSPLIAHIDPEITLQAPARTASTSSTPEQNLNVVNVPALWDLGFTGQGVVVANLDSGVDATHPDLIGRWRGGSNSWYDPYGQHPTSPTDLVGHGTWTMGVMVGGDAGGTSIGVAPGAKWIAAKIFNDGGTATSTAIHQSLQWVLDPDNDPNTADAPDVVNNSWTYGSVGCNLEFQLDLQALLAAGIVPVFAAGNYGSSASTSVSPANYPEALSVGAINNNSLIYSLSSRGPTSCGSAGARTYPDVVAPGVYINSTDLYGNYWAASGTSLAAPHVSGALALLLSAFPNLTAADQRAALIGSAVDLGTAGADTAYGNGRIDVFAAYSALANGAVPTPTSAPMNTPTDTPIAQPTATSTPTSTPTNTPTSTPAPTNTPTPTVTATNTPTSGGTLFANGFEEGNANAWSAASGNVSVTSGGAQAGTAKLQASIGGAPGYVQDNTPANEASYHARFYFNPNGLTTGTGSSPATIDLFDGRNTANTIIFQVQYRRSTKTGYQVRLGVVRSGGTTYTSWYTVNGAAWNAIEIAWQSGSSSSASFYTGGT